MLCSVVPQQTFSVSNSLFSCISVLEKPTFDDVDALVANINETQTVCTPKTSAKASTKTSFSTTFTDPGKKKSLVELQLVAMHKELMMVVLMSAQITQVALEHSSRSKTLPLEMLLAREKV